MKIKLGIIGVLLGIFLVSILDLLGLGYVEWKSILNSLLISIPSVTGVLWIIPSFEDIFGIRTKSTYFSGTNITTNT